MSPPRRAEELAWLRPLLPEKEIRRLVAAPAAERERFLARFWRGLDPDPATERNEFREGYLERFEFVRRHFSEGKPGWRTDRGRVWLYYGKPAERLVLAAETVRIAGRGLKSPGSTAQERTWAAPEAEIWTYNRRLDPEAPGPVSFIFMRLSLRGVTELAAGKVPGRLVEGDFQPFRLVYAGAPRSFNQPSLHRLLHSLDRFENQRLVTLLLSSPLDRWRERRARLRRLAESVHSRVSFGRLPADFHVWFLQGGDGYTYLALAAGVPRAELRDTTSLLFFGGLRRSSEPVAQFSESLTLPAGEGRGGARRGKVVLQSRLAARAGPYHLGLSLLDREGGRLAHWEREIEVPAWKAGMELSDLILCREVLDLERDPLPGYGAGSRVATDSDPLKVDHWLLVPQPNGRFGRAGSIVVFFEVYRPGGGKGKPDLEVEVVLRQHGNVVGRAAGRRLEYWTRGEIPKVSYALSLDPARMAPGAYDLEVVIRDARRGIVRRKSVPLEVVR